MRKMRRKLAVLLVFVLAFTMMPQNVLAAKKKVKLSKKSVTVTVGKTVKVKLKNNKKKVKWTVVSGKKNVKLSKKKKTGVTIHGKKAGKAKVQAKVGKKKFVCKVTVKKAGTNQNADKNNGKNEVADRTVSYRLHGEQQSTTVSMEDFLAMLQEDIRTKKLNPAAAK